MSAYPDGLEMYCPTCMVEVPTKHKHVGETLVIYCPKEHFVTRFIRDPSTPTGWKLDPEAYGR
jgi:hypothetical protein